MRCGGGCGKLINMKPSAVTMRTLGSCELSLHSGSAKFAHAEMTIGFKDGKADKLKATYPNRTDPCEVRLDICDLKVEGDRFSGTIAVAVKGKDGKEENLSYRMDAIADGDSVAGLWHGMADGKHILNKSSKLYGRVLASTSALETLNERP